MNDVVETKKTHLWKKGQSGNPKGRPPGSKNAISLVKLQIEGELRAQMQGRMAGIVSKMLDMAEAGDKDMLKTLYSSWVSKTRSDADEPAREKIQIVIGKLDQMPEVKGRTISNTSKGEE